MDRPSENAGLIFKPSESFRKTLIESEKKQFIDMPDRPSHYEYAFLSNAVYEKNGATDKLLEGWRLQSIFSTSRSRLEEFDLPIQSDNESRLYWVSAINNNIVIKKDDKIPRISTLKEDLSESGYVSILYVNDYQCQAVLANRGTSLLNLGALIADLEIVKQKVSSQQVAALLAAQQSIKFCRESSYRFSVTGHSLGGWLAEVTVYYCLEEGKPYFYRDISAVTFDAPGSANIMGKMDNYLKKSRKIAEEALDITHYVFIPNLINTCNKQVGTVYRIIPEWFDRKRTMTFGELFDLSSHKVDHFYKTLPKQDRDISKFREHVLGWPELNLDNTLRLLKGLLTEKTLSISSDLVAVSKKIYVNLKGVINALFINQPNGELNLAENNRIKKFFEGDYGVAHDAHLVLEPDNPQELLLMHFEAGVIKFLQLYYVLKTQLSIEQWEKVAQVLEGFPKRGRDFLSHYKLDTPNNFVNFQPQDIDIGLTKVIFAESRLGTIFDFRRYLTHALCLYPELLEKLEEIHQERAQKL